jgi:hypothetical protein
MQYCSESVLPDPVCTPSSAGHYALEPIANGSTLDELTANRSPVRASLLARLQKNHGPFAVCSVIRRKRGRKADEDDSDATLTGRARKSLNAAAAQPGLSFVQPVYPILGPLALAYCVNAAAVVTRTINRGDQILVAYCSQGAECDAPCEFRSWTCARTRCRNRCCPLK